MNENGDGQASAPILVYDGSQHLDVNMTSPTGLQEDLWGVMGVLGLMPVAVAIIVTVIVFVKVRTGILYQDPCLVVSLFSSKEVQPPSALHRQRTRSLYEVIVIYSMFSMCMDNIHYSLKD